MGAEAPGDRGEGTGSGGAPADGEGGGCSGVQAEGDRGATVLEGMAAVKASVVRAESAAWAAGEGKGGESRMSRGGEAEMEEDLGWVDTEREGGRVTVASGSADTGLVAVAAGWARGAAQRRHPL